MNDNREARYREANGSVVAVVAVADAEQAGLKAEVERWVEKANEAGKAYADANAKHHEELDRANRLEGMCERLAKRAVEYQDAQRAAEAALTSEREAHAGLRARLEALADEWREKAEDRRGRRDRIPRGGSLNQERDRAEWQGESRVYGHAAGSIHVALAAEPAAPVAAEEGGEQEAGEAACEHETTVVLHSPGDDEWAVACAVCTPEPSRWLDVGLTYEDAAALAQRHQESTP